MSVGSETNRQSHDFTPVPYDDNSNDGLVIADEQSGDMDMDGNSDASFLITAEGVAVTQKIYLGKGLKKRHDLGGKTGGDCCCGPCC